MQKTLLEVQRLLVDVRSDAVLFNLTPTVNKVERALQLLEGVIHEHKVKFEFKRAFKGVRDIWGNVIGHEDEK